MTDAAFSIEDWARMPLVERKRCSRAFNVHVHFLAPEIGDPQTQLEVAKRRLASIMSWVLIVEEFQESLQLFQYIFGTDLVHYTPIFNLNTYEKTLSAHALEIVREHNKYDIELYKYALERHRAQMAMVRADSLDPFYKPEIFACDPEVVCWDKATLGGPAWERADAAWQNHFTTEGLAKENQLCANKRGCWRSDVANFEQ